MKRGRQMPLLGAFASAADQIARTVQPGYVREAAARQFERVPALPATQIEDPVRALQPGAPNQEIDFLLGITVILDHIAVGFEVKRIEQGTPPFRGQVPLQIGNGAKRSRSAGRLAGYPLGLAAGRMKGFVL